MNDYSEVVSLYDKNDTDMMKIIFENYQSKISRIHEIINFSKAANYKIIGIAYCNSVKKYAFKLKEILENHFEVLEVSCKVGKLPLSELIENGRGIACNPVLQAKALNEEQTDLNITMGLCVGHDIIFAKYSNAPITTLIVKDQKHRHCSIKELTTE